jgi:hypothetical protein
MAMASRARRCTCRSPRSRHLHGDGTCRSGFCGGTYVFDPDSAFADALAKRGIGRPTPQEQFALAISEVGTEYVEALAAAGDAKPDVRLLVRAARHGVGFEYLRAMIGLGYRVGALDRLIPLRDHGVDTAVLLGGLIGARCQPAVS